ncbi:Coatomer beta subunit [Trema orientale]|uniref:Coatomer beta subunit n=1 Tax=Trema orientale TaxID=63057 RepID=A0A2P5F1T0_TREOI|nr:Coatomer beta subunit [Trema orientale]
MGAMARARARARASPSSGSWLLLLLMVMLAVARADLLNKSSLSFPIEEEEQVDGDGDFDADGGFSSLDGMLQWAIGHSDPATLKESAKHVSTDDLNKRQSEIKELMNNLNMPSDAELMQIAINDLLNNSSNLSLQDRHRALQELLILVEPIHNANDLNKLGGLAVVIRELNHPDPHTRTLAAWILGKSAQNNPSLQTQVLELGALSKLMKMVKSHVVEEANKGLYAVSALIRNNFDGQELFYAEAGALLLQDLLSNATTDIRLQKKAVLLVGDLADSQVENYKEDAHDVNVVVPLFSNRILLKSVVDLTASSDLDLQEKGPPGNYKSIATEDNGGSGFEGVVRSGCCIGDDEAAASGFDGRRTPKGLCNGFGKPTE